MLALAQAWSPKRAAKTTWTAAYQLTKKVHSCGSTSWEICKTKYSASATSECSTRRTSKTSSREPVNLQRGSHRPMDVSEAAWSHIAWVIPAMEALPHLTILREWNRHCSRFCKMSASVTTSGSLKRTRALKEWFAKTLVKIPATFEWDHPNYYNFLPLSQNRQMI